MEPEQVPEPVEYDLIRRIGEGDRSAFEEFYEKFAGVVYSTCLRVLDDHRDAEDVAQEVFALIWEKAKQYDPSRGKPLTWAVTMTRNKAIDKLRSLQRRFRLREELEKEAGASGIGGAADTAPASGIESAEDAARLREAISKLEKKQREVIEMVYFGGMTQAEIAARLREPIGTIKARVRRALLKLRNSITKI